MVRDIEHRDFSRRGFFLRAAILAGTYVASYWWIYCGITVLSAVVMWWVPYFFGTKEETKREYATMYAGTIQVLPARGDNPRPNLLHLFFHALFLLNLGLALWLKFGAS